MLSKKALKIVCKLRGKYSGNINFFTRKYCVENKLDGIAVGMYSNGELTEKATKIDNKLGNLLSKHIEILELKGKVGESSLVVNTFDDSLPKKIALTGMGEKKEFSYDKKEVARKASGASVNLVCCFYFWVEHKIFYHSFLM